MLNFLKINNLNKVHFGNAVVSDSTSSVQSPVVNNTENPTSLNNSLPDNAAYRVLPAKNTVVNTANYAKMFSQLSEFVDDESKKYLQTLHESKKLLSNNSNDGSSTIENLYKIMTEPRAGGFDPKILLKETMKTLADPYIITQDFGKIPEAVVPQLINEENTRVQQKLEEEKKHPQPQFEKKEILKNVNQTDINFSKGHTCPAASMEFDLADKKPSEFARYVERLTSPDKCVKTKIKFSNIADDLPAAVSKLQDWKIDYKKLNADNIEVTLHPDENAYPRAIIQEYGRAKDSRSVVDALLQSTFMQEGSEKTYNSLTDLRSEDTGNGRGLNQEEGAFMESIVDYEGGKDSVTYMDLDENLTKINKYNFDPQTTEAQLIETLSRGKNIMVGYLTDVDEKGTLLYRDDKGNIVPKDEKGNFINKDEKGNIIPIDEQNPPSMGGHEILLTGVVLDKNGERYFKYNDTDDGDHYAPSYIKVSELIRTLHHANIPKDVIKKYIPQQQDSRLSLIADYWQLKKQNTSAPEQQKQA